MRDEVDVRARDERHLEVSRGIDRLMDAFRKLVAIQYDAPWRAARSRWRL